MTMPLPPTNQRRTEDLLRQAKEESKNLPRETVKLAVIELLAVLLSAAAGTAYLLYLAGPLSPGIFITVLAAFFVVSFLGTLFGSTLRHRALIIFLEAVAFLAPFYDMKPTLLLAAFAPMFFFSFWGERQSRNDTRNMVNFRFLRSARLKMGKLFTGILLGAMILFLPQWQEANVFISEDRFERYYTVAAARLNVLYSKLDFTSSVGEFARSLARTKLATDPRFADMPPDLQDKALDTAEAEFISAAERNLDIDITSDMTLGGIMYHYLADLLAGWKEKFGDSFLALWAVTVFVIARGLGAIFIWITLYAAYFFYQALVAWGVIELREEPKTQERPLLT